MIQLKDLWYNKEKRWQITMTISFLISIAFALYNGFLGLYKHSIWNGCICVYYLLLLSIKALILISETKLKNEDDNIKAIKRKKTFYISSVLLFLINIALFAPVTLMVLNKRSIEFGLIPAITIAAYTTYKVTLSIISYTKNRKNINLAVRQIRTINLIDSILSILTMQNALIIVNSGSTNKLFTLTAITSFIGIVIIITLSIVLFVRCIKEK